MLIRPPTPADLPAIARVELDARAAAEQRWSPPPDGLRILSVDVTAEAWRRRIEDGSTRVAIVDLTIVGCIAWRPIDGLPTAYGPFVDPPHARTGIGRALLAVAMRRARLAGHDRMALWLAAADPRARLFARAMGFVADGAYREVDGNPAGEVRRVAVLPAGLALGGA